MKKLMVSIFAMVLMLISFNVSPAMAAGNTNADAFQRNGQHYNTIKERKALYNSPSNSTVVNYVSPVQDVKIRSASLKIQTWLGPKWVRFSPGIRAGAHHDKLHHTFNAGNATLYVENKLNLYNTAAGIEYSTDSVSPYQTVNVTSVWYEIDTWLGPKWIGYVM